MKNSKTLEFMNNLNEKINKDNIEINKAIANPNLGRNQDRIKQAGYDIQYDGDYIKNPKTGKGVWPKNYNRDEKKKVDFKGKLDSERPTMSKTTRYDFDVKDNRIPKSAKIGKNAGYGTYNSDEIESYSPLYRDAGKKSVSANINYYKKAVADRDEARSSAEYNKKHLNYYKDKVKDAQKDLDREKDFINKREKEADWAEQKRKELIDKVRAKKTSTVKEGAKPLAKGLKKIIKEAEEDNPLEGKDIFYVFEDFDTGVDENQEKLIKYVNEDLKLGLDPIKDDLKIALEIQKMTGEQVIRLIHMCYGDEIGNKFEEYLDTRLEAGLNTNKIKYIKIKESKLTEARQEEILGKLPKKKINEEEVYSEPGQEQQLNEETVGEKITAPSGKFWVGDPCYVLSDDVYYGIWDDKYNFEDGKIDVDDKLSFLVHGTAYGDGSYQSSNGFDYGVDSGTLAVIPMDLIAKLDGVQFGTVETSNTAWLDYNDGNFDITLDNKSFTIETGDYEEDEDDWRDNIEDDDLDESENSTENKEANEIIKQWCDGNITISQRNKKLKKIFNDEDTMYSYVLNYTAKNK